MSCTSVLSHTRVTRPSYRPLSRVDSRVLFLSLLLSYSLSSLTHTYTPINLHRGGLGGATTNVPTLQRATKKRLTKTSLNKNAKLCVRAPPPAGSLLHFDCSCGSLAVLQGVEALERNLQDTDGHLVLKQ